MIFACDFDVISRKMYEEKVIDLPLDRRNQNCSDFRIKVSLRDFFPDLLNHGRKV